MMMKPQNVVIDQIDSNPEGLRIGCMFCLHVDGPESGWGEGRGISGKAYKRQFTVLLTESKKREVSRRVILRCWNTKPAKLH